MKNYQITNRSSFSLLEIIVFILIVAIILVVALPKYGNIVQSSNLTKLKSEYATILKGISDYKSKAILLAKEGKINILDDASVNTKDEKLFSKVVLDFDTWASTSNDKEIGTWIKTSNNTYTFMLSNSKEVNFKLENSNFICVSPKDICDEIY